MDTKTKAQIPEPYRAYASIISHANFDEIRTSRGFRRDCVESWKGSRGFKDVFYPPWN